jgi:hypothetical protein
MGVSIENHGNSIVRICHGKPGHLQFFSYHFVIGAILLADSIDDLQHFNTPLLQQWVGIGIRSFMTSFSLLNSTCS